MKKYIAIALALVLCASLWACTAEGSSHQTGPDSPTTSQSGWTEKDGMRCYLRTDGTPVSGWLDDQGMRFYLDDNGFPLTGWQELSGKRFYFREDGSMTIGWAQLDGVRYYFGVDGAMITGLMNIEGKGYYFNADGSMHTGWLTEEDRTYYFDSQGVMAVGPAEIDGKTHYFSPHGVKVLLVNPWNYVPEGYAPELVSVTDRDSISVECFEALEAMLDGCRAAGHSPYVVSGYRTQADQTYLFERKVDYYLELEWEEEAARVEAAKTVAIPGTSEHQLGLAVDIVDLSYPHLDDAQADTAGQKWLMAHCHEYGFILRYPKDSTSITGIIYEPWHYRYVGVEIAQEITNLGITLEEYLDAVVTD